MDPNRPSGGEPRLWKRLGRCLAGLAYLGVVAVVLSGLTRVAPATVFLAVLAAAVFCTALALFWLTRWALRKENRRGQFGLASLFFLTTLAAAYFGVVRWLVVHLRPEIAGGSSDGPRLFLMVGVLCIFLAMVAVPFLAGMAEGLVWLAVWIVRRPFVRHWLARRRRPPKDP